MYLLLLMFSLAIIAQENLILRNCGSSVSKVFASDVDRTFTVTIDHSYVVHVVDERYLSLTFSLRWLGTPSAPKLFLLKRFRALLQGLAPTYLRIGGTAAEYLTFNGTASLQNVRYEATDDSTSDTSEVYSIKIDGFAPFTVSGYHWDLVNEFAKQNGARLIFGVNDMKRKNGHWEESNFIELLNYTLQKHYATNLDFELGNEPNAYKNKFNVTISAAQHARDFVHMSDILKRTQPYSTMFNDAILIGPDVTQPTKDKILNYLKSYLEVVGAQLNKITWHQYYLKAKTSLPIGISNFTDPCVLDGLQKQIISIKDVAKEAGFGSKPIWLGETGSASGGGVHGYSNRYVAVFMWLDKLGLAAENGIDVVIRQSFYGYSCKYALIDDDMEPLPDYWVAYIYKRLVGRHVIKTEVHDYTGKLRCYAASNQRDILTNNTKKNITIYCLNLHNHEIKMELEINGIILRIEAYILRAHGEGGLQSRYIQLNGEKLEMKNNTEFPDLNAKELNPGDPISLPAFSVAFFTVQLT